MWVGDWATQIRWQPHHTTVPRPRKRGGSGPSAPYPPDPLLATARKKAYFVLLQEQWLTGQTSGRPPICRFGSPERKELFKKAPDQDVREGMCFTRRGFAGS